MEAGKRPHDVVGTEIMISTDGDGVQAPLRYPQFDGGIRNFLGGNAHSHRDEAAHMVGFLQFNGGGPKAVEGDIGAKGAINIRQGQPDLARGQDGVALDQVVADGKVIGRARFGHMNPMVVFRRHQLSQFARQRGAGIGQLRGRRGASHDALPHASRLGPAESATASTGLT